MPPHSTVGGLIAASTLGCAVHRLCFKPYEPASIPSLGVLLVLLPVLLSVLLSTAAHLGYPATAAAFLTYYLSLLLSVTAYRLSPAHPLAAHRGPLLCKLTKLWLAYQAYTGKLYLYMQHLHEVYGPVVRIGPNELSVIDADLLPRILGAEGMPKGPMWEGRRFSGKSDSASVNDRGNLIGNRYKDRHAEARRAWNRAFTPSAVKDYEAILVRRVAQLSEVLGTRESSGTVDLSLWLSYCIFDFMGDMVFGGGFELMHEGDQAGVYRDMVSGLLLPAVIQHVPWVSPMIPYLPWVARHTIGFGNFAYKCIMKRLQEGSVRNDLFFHLLDEVPDPQSQTPIGVIFSNAITAMLAGSDTTAIALCNVFYCLLAHPEVYERLREEVDSAFPPGSGDPIDASKLAGLSYLNAVINEALRLFPSGPTSVQRAPQPGTGFHHITPTFVINEETAIVVPPYVLHRNPLYFSPHPDQFWPERWMRKGEPGVVIHPGAYIPFSMGAPNCVGRPVALLVMRMVIAWLMLSFDIALADGYDIRQWEADLKDYLTFQKGPLPVVLSRRL